MNDLENHLVLPVADDMRDGPYECFECRDCGAQFYRDDRLYIMTGLHTGKLVCPRCGCDDLDEFRSRDELNEALVDIARSLSLEEK